MSTAPAHTPGHARVLLAAPVVIASVAFALVGPSPWSGLGLAGAALFPALVSWRVTLPRWAELVACAVVGTVAASLLPGSGAGADGAGVLGPPWDTLAMIAIAIAVLRTLLRAPWGGAAATIGVALVGLTACGGARSGAIFPVAVAVFVLASAAARHAADRGARAFVGLTPRHLGTGVVVTAVATVLAGATSLILPIAHDRVLQGGALGGTATSRTGFSDRFELGDVSRLLQSDEVVM